MRLSSGVDAIAEWRITDARTANQIAVISGFVARLVATGIESDVLGRGQCKNLEASLARREVTFGRDGGPKDHGTTAAAV